MSLNGQELDADRPPSLRQLIQDMSKAQNEHIKKTERLFTIVLGDKDASIPGLVQKVESHGKYISFDKKLKIFGAGLAGSGLAGGVAYFDSIKEFILHFK